MAITDKPAVPLWKSTRLWLPIWGFIGCTLMYTLRFGFSVAIVCMTYEANDTEAVQSRELWRSDVIHDPIQAYVMCWLPGHHDDDECEGDVSKGVDDTGEFDWSRQLRGTMSSSFFWGYVLTQVPGGSLAQRIGGKRVMFWGILLSTMCSLLSPPAARISPYALIAMRFISGLGQGVFFPAYFNMIGKWALPNERAKSDAIFSSGTAMGSMLSFALSGVICDQLGWVWIFYIYGIATFIWCIVWWFVAFDTPALHPRISQEEKEDIERILGAKKAESSKGPPIPWRGVLTSVALWSVAFSDFCINWATYTGLTSLPQYMEDVLKFDITANGLYSAIPQLAKFLSGFVFAGIGDWVLTRGYCGVTLLRKIMHSFTMLVPMCFVIGVGYMDCNQAILAILFLTLQEAFMGALRAGSSVTRIDMAPRFSGVVMGICNTSGNIAGIIAPIVVGSITTQGTRSQWQTCFFISAGAYLVGWLSFVLFASSEEQEWAKRKEDVMEMKVPSDDAEDGREKTSAAQEGGQTQNDLQSHQNGHALFEYEQATFENGDALYETEQIGHGDNAHIAGAEHNEHEQTQL